MSLADANARAYDRIAAAWDEARRSFYGRERDYVDLVLDGLPPASCLLDLGCGTGRPIAEYVLARGHRIVGLDQAEALLAIARRRFPAARWEHARLETLTLDGLFAGAICWDALFHVERAYHRTILATVARHLAPGARLMLTVGGSAHPAFVDTMFGEELFYDSHPPDAAVALVRDVGFEPILTEFMNLPTDGRDKGRFAIVARRVDSGPPGST